MVVIRNYESGSLALTCSSAPLLLCSCDEALSKRCSVHINPVANVHENGQDVGHNQPRTWPKTSRPLQDEAARLPSNNKMSSQQEISMQTILKPSMKLSTILEYDKN